MATWTQTLEPYIKVQERVKTVALNPTAGESLIIGAVFISDAGPSTPTLITSQSEFLSTYASKDMSQEYIESLNTLYTGDDNTLASTMWKNAYRLAGSNTLLMVRASKATDIFFARPLTKGDQNVYILRDGELLKKMPSFKFVLDIDSDEANHDQDGWSININGVGIFGNRTTDDGAQYDYFVNSLPDLIEQLNDTSKFFSPAYKFYSDVKCEHEVSAESTDAIAVVFEEVYLGVSVLDTTDPRCGNGMMYLIACQPDYEDDAQEIIDLNNEAWSGFTPSSFYATNVYNSASNLKVRIRRFNHDAVSPKEISEQTDLTQAEVGTSPYTVLTSVLDTLTKNGSEEVSEQTRQRDFYEVAVLDPSINDTVSFFTVGNVTGRGDMTVAELNDMLKMIQLTLPDDMAELGLNYFGYRTDDRTWVRTDETPTSITPMKTVNDKADLWTTDSQETEPAVGDIWQVGVDTMYQYAGEGNWEKMTPLYQGHANSVSDLWKPGSTDPEPTLGDKWVIWSGDDAGVYKYSENGLDQIFADLTIDPLEYKILSVSDADLKKALDLIVLDEVYTTEGLCDLGNTELSFQSYMANVAINDNYFYPISTVNSSNYMTIGNSATKLSQDSYKLYMSAPWDIDASSVGYTFYASPAVLYWEAVARNRRNNREFAPVFGQTTGIMQYQRPAVEFNKKQRQLLLSRKVNTVIWNTNQQAWNNNDNYTKQVENTIMNDEGNSRLMIRISKAVPTLLKQFIGKRISEKLCADVVNVLEYFFKTTILPMEYTVDAYQIFCDYDEALARQNKIKVVINVRYQRALKFVTVVNNAFDVGMDISNPDA